MKRVTKAYESGFYGYADDLKVDKDSDEFRNILMQRLGIFEDRFDQLERLARIGKATEKAFEKVEQAIFLTFGDYDEENEEYITERRLDFDNVQELLEWAETED